MERWLLSNYNTANPVFTATAPGSYTFTVTVSTPCGITASCNITICVTDIGVPGQHNKVYICHAPPGNKGNAKTHAVSVNSVAEHLLNHQDDKSGICGEAPCQLITSAARNVMDEALETGISVTASPNPTTSSAF